MKAHDVEPQNIIILDRLAVTSLHLKNYGNTEEYLLAIFEINPSNSSAVNNLGLLYEEIGDLERAYDYYKVAIGINPEGWIAWSNLGIVACKLLLLEEGVKNLQKAYRLNAGNKNILEHLRLAYWVVGNSAVSRKILRKIIYLFPDDYAPYIYLVAKYLEASENGKALKIMLRAMKINGNAPILHLKLSQVYLFSSNISEALNVFLRAVMRGPEFASEFMDDNFVFVP